MNSAFAGSQRARKVLMYEGFVGVAIATEAPLVAIAEQIGCKHGHVGLPATWGAGDPMRNAGYNKEGSRDPNSARLSRLPGGSG